MPQDIMLTDMPGGVFEEGEHGLINLDIREGDTQGNGRQERSMPLGVPLTGNMLFTISWILGLGIPKAIYSNRGQSLISPTLDWVGGIIFTLISLWLAVVETKRPELCPAFFEADLAPCILTILCRGDVLLWLTSVQPLVLAVEGMSFAKQIQWQVAMYATAREVELQLDNTQFVLGVSMTVFLFCIHGLRVLWPKGFEGTGQYVFLAFNAVMMAHLLFLVVKISKTDSFFMAALGTMTIRLYIWVMPWAAPPILGRHCCEGPPSRYPPFLRRIIQYNIVTCCVVPVIAEVATMLAWALFKYPNTKYSSLYLSCCALVPIWRGFTAISPPSRVAWLISVLEAAYGRVRSAGIKAKAHALDLCYRF